MSFFKKIFGQKDEPIKEISHPSHLQPGDMITFDNSFVLPTELRGGKFEIMQINTYEYESGKELEWVLKGGGLESIYLGLNKLKPDYMSLSIKIPRSIVESLFNMDNFADIFEEDNDKPLTPLSKKDDQFELWLGDCYYRNCFANFGYFHHIDYRVLTSDLDTGSAFELYELLDNSETKALEIKVYEHDNTEVFLTINRPLNDIVNYWDGSSVKK